jgi:outer membrane receptor for ferrienterochelin and colicins
MPFAIALGPLILCASIAAVQQPPVVPDPASPPTVEVSVVVSATRTEGRLEDQPLRVEVLEREEIEEKMLMTPGDIVMMLNEMGGMRVQATSPSLGAASVRIQGMRGRYTRFLSDGLPLFGEVGGLGLLQIPPMDLAQVEVIKGVASSLYGAGAMGGVVNLVSRRPAAEAERELLVNRSTRGGTDAVGFYSAPLSGRWGLTMLGSGHWQERADVDGDRWSDLPNYARGVVRPRLFWSDGAGRSFFATAGMTAENRRGGTAPDVALPIAGTPYVEALDTRRWDAGAVGQTLVRQKYVVTARAALSQQRHRHQFGELIERDRHTTAFAETTVRGAAGRHTWVGGVAVEHDAYRAIDLPRFSHTFTVPGVFGQDDIAFAPWLSVSLSGRLDHHSEYGTFLSPRLAVLLRSGDWNSRVSIGTGFFGPSALTEETEAAGLTRLSVPTTLRAEQGRSFSLDVTRARGPFSSTATVFASRVANPITVERSAGFVLMNASDPTTNVGAEWLGTIRHAPFALTTTYTYVRSLERINRETRDVPLTPRHSAGMVGMWEREDVGRVGLELYYTGTQRLEANPFAERSEPYVILGLLAEKQFGRIRLFVNGENLTGVRQSRWQPLIRPNRAPDGRWTVDAWAPLEGRNINGGVRVSF